MLTRSRNGFYWLRELRRWVFKLRLSGWFCGLLMSSIELGPTQNRYVGYTQIMADGSIGVQICANELSMERNMQCSYAWVAGQILQNTSKVYLGPGRQQYIGDWIWACYCTTSPIHDIHEKLMEFQSARSSYCEATSGHCRKTCFVPLKAIMNLGLGVADAVVVDACVSMMLVSVDIINGEKEDAL
ncbi:uncharacterized protein EV420DRAFT_1481617 [Desarmillaria tabescens]|uniref:Uncharacterized protein n=1 Tax=Armillaria tabescens TaxID=1929756 RepID=A0AA39K411_ARMTA|nr:uncharacterized protein EV420DRAFT_1481617 [Desarmillaria tabescens]KAK0454177.1 hypothetical protein EV420DRAFT_1481617 [Desarmillaria tabescens]